MSKEKCVNKKLHPYCKTGIYGWLGEEVDDNDYVICPICGAILGMNYWDYSAEHDGDNKCPECGQELDYSEVYDFEDTLYFRQLLEIKDAKIENLEHRLANCIETKFKPKNDLFVIVGYKDEPKTIEQYYIDEIVVRGNGTLVEYRDIEKETIVGENNLLFATEEEAKAKLREIQK